MVRKPTTKGATEQETDRSVDPQSGIQLLRRLIEQATELSSRPQLVSSDVQAWKATARDYLVRAFGSRSPNVSLVIHASGDTVHLRIDARRYYQSELCNKIKMLSSCIEQLETEIELEAHSVASDNDDSRDVSESNRLFVVHGHNHGFKESVARFIEKMGLEPVILHEKPNEGRTIIEKFSDYSDVHFAVVLLTGDDEGRAKDSTAELKSRARQNVILELGYFLGKLGRARVCALYQQGVELPSDYQGVLFVPLDSNERWKFDLLTELKAAGFAVDANRIFTTD
ncbi:MAG: nucleotide-binding protein [Syntrophorhabdales bacterium]|jgi:predicted nucleotide-binding protein